MRLLISGMASMLTLLLGTAADAAEVAVLCANGMQTVLEAVAPNFEKASGYRLKITFDTGGGTIKRAG